MGDIPQLPCMGIVGTRQPSPYGKKMVKILTLDLIKAGFCIVSGFARGIDTWAHETVLKYNGSTIAVFGNGLDICYPGKNRKLWELLLENCAFISEFIPGTKPDAVNFPKRNRIISGLSKGVLIIEEKLIWERLSQNPIHIDELCIQLKKDSPDVLSTLLMLELKNIVQQHPGKLFTK